MTESQFNDWKESSAFFFDHWKTSVDEHAESMRDIGIQLANCDPADLPKIHKQATIIGARADLLSATLDIEYADIFGNDDD